MIGEGDNMLVGWLDGGGGADGSLATWVPSLLTHAQVSYLSPVEGPGSISLSLPSLPRPVSVHDCFRTICLKVQFCSRSLWINFGRLSKKPRAPFCQTFGSDISIYTTL